MGEPALASLNKLAIERAEGDPFGLLGYDCHLLKQKKKGVEGILGHSHLLKPIKVL
jgi:hypothetical protein